MELDVLPWIQLAVRWFHLVAGIAWIALVTHIVLVTLVPHSATNNPTFILSCFIAGAAMTTLCFWLTRPARKCSMRELIALDAGLAIVATSMLASIVIVGTGRLDEIFVSILIVGYIVLGHTHYQMAERAGRALVINPGSAGEARDPRNHFKLSYAVLDTASDEVTFDDFADPTRAAIDPSIIPGATIERPAAPREEPRNPPFWLPS